MGGLRAHETPIEAHSRVKIITNKTLGDVLSDNALIMQHDLLFLVLVVNS